MKHSIRTLAVMLCAVFLAGSLSACGDTTPAESAGTGTQELTGSETAVPETAGATVITFSGTSAAAEGAGAEITGGTVTVTVTAGGTYVVTGTAAEGRVIVNAPGEEVVLVLQNADITCADGINAADGSAESGMGGRPGAFGVASGCAIRISGGVITVEAGGDGIDSNGDITVSGGKLYISGSTGNGDSAIDCDGSAVITGGTVVAAGSSGMAQNFGADSTQGSILLSYPSAASGPITLQDAAGRTLVSYTPGKSYNCVVISCPAITQGSTYTVTACGQTASVTMSSLIYGSGGMGGPAGRP